MRCALFTVLVGVVIVVSQHRAECGGPLRYDEKGPMVWDTTHPISYKVDRGSFRLDGKEERISSEAVVASIRRAFEFWSNVPTASIRFRYDGLLGHDVRTAAEYFAVRDDPATGNVVILDQTGDIIDAVAGVGNRDEVLGFAKPVKGNGRIVRFYSVMNGHLADSIEQFEPTFVHEFGHAIGLDHSQIHGEMATNGIPDDDDFVPIMFPLETDSEKENPPRARRLYVDDLAWISHLYRNSMTSGTYGVIKGRVVHASDATRPLLGVNVVAINQDDPLIRCSCVSDYLKGNTGEFLIPVPKGKYKLFIEPIDDSFQAGSGVGPYTSHATDESFRTRVIRRRLSPVHEILAGNTVSGIEVQAAVEPGSGKQDP